MVPLVWFNRLFCNFLGGEAYTYEESWPEKDTWLSLASVWKLMLWSEPLASGFTIIVFFSGDLNRWGDLTFWSGDLNRCGRGDLTRFENGNLTRWGYDDFCLCVNICLCGDRCRYASPLRGLTSMAPFVMQSDNFCIYSLLSNLSKLFFFSILSTSSGVYCWRN